MEDLGPPYTWCDRACERCPLADACPVWHSARTTNRAHEERGEDPNDPHVVMGDIEETLRESLAMLEQIYREEGLDPDAPVEPPPRNPVAERLDAEAMALGLALHDVLESPAGRRAAARKGGGAAAEEISRAVLLFPGKVGRLGAYLESHGRSFEPEIAGNAAATFALLEHLDRTLGQALAILGVRSGLEAHALRRAHARLWRLLAPLRDGLPPEPRRALDALIAQGKAPSPFCLRGQGGGASATRRRSTPDPAAPQTSASTVTPPRPRSVLEYVRKS